MPHLALALVLSLTALLCSGCGRVETPPPAKPISIWTSQDSQAIAQQLCEAAAREPFTSQFRDRHGRAARIAVGEILDESAKSLDLVELTAAINRALAESGDKLAQSSTDQADFLVRGKISVSVISQNQQGQQTTLFGIDLKLADSKTGDPVWPFSVERELIGR